MSKFLKKNLLHKSNNYFIKVDSTSLLIIVLRLTLVYNLVIISQTSFVNELITLIFIPLIAFVTFHKSEHIDISIISLICVLFILQNSFYQLSNLIFYLLITLGLLSNKILKTYSFWLIILIILIYNIFLPPFIFSGKLLNIYWTIAICIGLALQIPMKVLIINARFLIGFVLLQAFIWKIITFDFLNGNFIRFSLQFCNVFRQPALNLGLITEESHQVNSQLIELIENSRGLISPILIEESNIVFITGIIITITIILLEGIIALAFLSPLKWKIASFRHYILLAFLWLVYSIIPVFVFAGLFSIMGLTLTQDNENKYRYKYISTFFFMIFLEFILDITDIVLYMRNYIT